MGDDRHMIGKTLRVLFWTLAAWACVDLLIPAQGLADTGDGSIDQRSHGNIQSLAGVRELVAHNESLSALIKMGYRLKLDMPGELLREADSGKLSPPGETPRSFTHRDGVWAQDNIKQHSSIDSFYGPDELAASDITVVDGEVVKWAQKPDLMQGWIADIGTFRWRDIPLTVLGSRPFAGKRLLSECLVPEYASIQNETATVEGRTAHIIYVKRPVDPAYFAKIWIDRERGLPLRLEYYDEHPTSDQARLMSKVEAITHYQLPNGGWIPVTGTRYLHFRDAKNTVVSENIIVDIDSVTIRREDIPDSLFVLDFPEGARVHNTILGVTFGPGGDADMILGNAVKSFMKGDSATGEAKSAPQAQPQATPSQKTSPQRKDTLDEPKADHKRNATLVWIFIFALLGAGAVGATVMVLRHRRGIRREKDVR